MTRRIFASIARALRDEPTEDRVHFHSGEHGRPYVCGDPHCTSPSLDVRDS